MQPITENFSLEELTRTDTGLPNEPPADVAKNLIRLCETALEPVRAMVGPLHINSGFRSAEVNKAVKGSPTSAHMTGLAADIVPMRVSRTVAFDLIADSGIPFDQLILEPTWVHIGLARDGVMPRRQLLEAVPTSQGMKYERVSR